MTNEIRQFDTGATRDTDVNKPSYIKALSPIVLQNYVEYLGRHRLQSDGNLRNWDNWKNGIPQDVYLDGLGRHEMAVWLLCHGFPASDNHGLVTLKDSLCGVIFNAQGMLHEILKEEQQFVCPAGWRIELFDNNSGWFIFNDNVGQHLHKDLQLHSGTGYCGHRYGQAPGYWPAKEAAEKALEQYLCGKIN